MMATTLTAAALFYRILLVLVSAALCCESAALFRSSRNHQLSSGGFQRIADVWENELEVIVDMVTEDAINKSGQATPIVAKGEVTRQNKTKGINNADQEQVDPLWVFGVHSGKAGSSLIRSLAKHPVSSLGYETCSAATCNFVEKHQTCQNFKGRGRAKVWFACEFNITQLVEAREEAKACNMPLRVVHVIRDPLGIVVSNYLYHKQSSGYARHQMNLSSALVLEAQNAISVQLQDMLEVYEDEGSDVMVVRFEDLMRSSGSFDKTVAAMYSFAAGDVADHTLLESLQTAAKESDLRRHPIQNSDHVNTQNLTNVAMDAIKHMPHDVFVRLHEYRISLGYQ